MPAGPAGEECVERETDMISQAKNSVFKHLDFIVLDLICLQVSFVLSFVLLVNAGNPYSVILYRYQIIIFNVIQLLMDFFLEPYKNILRRNTLQEIWATVKNVFFLMALDFLYLFAVHQLQMFSRRFVLFMMGTYLLLSYLTRTFRKRAIYKRRLDNKGRRSLMVITTRYMAEEAIETLRRSAYHDFFISGIILLSNSSTDEKEIMGIPAHGRGEDFLEMLSREWVDEVLFYLPVNYTLPERYLEALLEMGITVHHSFQIMNTSENSTRQENGYLGGIPVITSSIRIISVRDVALKRLADILGGITGCLLTGIIFIFIAPAIYIKSPGPIFFSQWRVGQNGRKFRIYKFRSMYMDAEERKKEYMEQNKIQDGLMFKMDDDPRIIGSEKKDKNGKPRGIGNFIRNTSLDEFPQFWNVLKGDMSLVGTRPPTLDEWEKYDLHHRIRMSAKPGITGMWQVSGRSKITDFEEVVRLDEWYIRNWSWELDARILFKTVGVVLRHEGAE